MRLRQGPLLQCLRVSESAPLCENASCSFNWKHLEMVDLTTYKIKNRKEIFFFKRGKKLDTCFNLDLLY